MNWWILQFNPNSFHMTQGTSITFFNPGEYDWWGISRYFRVIEPSNIAYIWQSMDYRFSGEIRPNGIYGKANIISVPPHEKRYQELIDELKERDLGTWQEKREEVHQKKKPAILIEYCEPSSALSINPLTATELKAAGLGNIGPLRFTRTDIYKLTNEEVTRIENLIKSKLKK